MKILFSIIKILSTVVFIVFVAVYTIYKINEYRHGYAVNIESAISGMGSCEAELYFGDTVLEGDVLWVKHTPFFDFRVVYVMGEFADVVEINDGTTIDSNEISLPFWVKSRISEKFENFFFEKSNAPIVLYKPKIGRYSELYVNKSGFFILKVEQR